MTHRTLIIAGFVAAVLGYPTPSTAHRLDEYLQASRIAVNRDAVTLELDLTPGVDVADRVIAQIDANRDGRISSAEGLAYATAVLRDVSVEIDGQRLQTKLLNNQFPELHELNTGMGSIRLTAAAQLPSNSASGRHELFYRNVHQPEISVYLANALVPSDDRIQISGQRRDYAQHDLAINYRVAERDAPRSVWLIAGLMIAGLGGIESLRRRKS